MGSESAGRWLEASEELEWGDVIDLEALWRDTVGELRAHQLIGASVLESVRPLGEPGWVRSWHSAISLCLDHAIAYGDDRTIAAAYGLFRALCDDHEEARRCASR
jgi:hypothetical protein